MKAHRLNVRCAYKTGRALWAISTRSELLGMNNASAPANQFQPYVIYKSSPGTSFSVGDSGRFGGERSLSDVYTGTKTRNDQL